MPFVTENQLAGWSTVELGDESSGATAVVVPGRGGLIAQFSIGEKQMLFLDEATLADPGKNVRGGVPVLFPTPGKLSDDRWHLGGQSGTLPQHGFARTLPWQVLGTLEGAVPSVALSLDRMGDANWPWDCRFDLTISLRGSTLRLDQRVTNRGRASMPFGVGFHPYFHVPDGQKADALVDTNATRAFDNVTKQIVAPRLDFTVPELDLHLLDHGRSSCALRLPDRTITLSGSDEFQSWVLWTLGGRDFICVEPWTCPGDALNSGEKLLIVEPNQSRSLWLEVTVDDSSIGK